MRRLTAADQRFALAGRMLAAVLSAPAPTRPVPKPKNTARALATELTDDERRLSGALMRVNHVGEVCAQALYEGQAMTTRDPSLRADFLHAAQEEGDHLYWTRERLRELNDRPSWLNPLWYGGSLLIGMAAGRAGDSLSLGFMAETERQVAAHLDGHLQRLPAGDQASRAIVETMKEDEARHADHAVDRGGVDLPPIVRSMMKAASTVMTRTAHHI
ncbi:MAG: 2-polyprenyl-3-methyl-6-methoxy-1,4-benzoquinone monooxygenase [Burkholderiaceae bacterium]